MIKLIGLQLYLTQISNSYSTPKIESGTGEQQTLSIIDSLDDWGIADKIKSLCFDTTTSNTGPHSGACATLERILEKKFLYFACRYHVYELVLRKACQTCLPATSDPNVSTFERFLQTWKNIDQSNYITGLDNEIIRDKVMDERDNVLPFISKQLNV
ncbi:unnamed protein product [Psylliodes chrysocephalus]|uniref:Uncharacterized protein n=1 Tax=Psylliodes chrysocephalus TaxID=3402493 RepID=A0A9P0CU31_9CUCU|nr:unnamed protein product [Psylliodes chrysocephala]